eukprot:CAMPEP_0178449598 /NCGR_PEP_ID=MMETSP0689_2-20121128/42647_1 /TAXON_ID=160604 /ORGANISM="Amphidinium massartii, Strain CS-259" /LENGTH=87 /DNA_ID=CAMNT_0020074949 /DNA_START=383 /DNA_END=646 /DNA_ORIENTATION=-
MPHMGRSYFCVGSTSQAQSNASSAAVTLPDFTAEFITFPTDSRVGGNPQPFNQASAWPCFPALANAFSIVNTICRRRSVGQTSKTFG